MTTPDKLRIVAETPYLRLVEQNGWAYVQRHNATGVVCVAALTSDEKLLLVEQFRPPVGCHVVELPAGLAGDLIGAEHEALESAARRELSEETGYEAEVLQEITTAPSSAGLTDESVTFFVAEGLRKVHDGGGDESEEIEVHEVNLDEVDTWLDTAIARGALVDAKLYSGLYFLRQHRDKH